MTASRVTTKTTINCNLKKVWDYYTLPEHIVQWNFAEPSWHCPNAENDLRPGGKMKSRMEAKNDSFCFDFEATCNEVID